MTKRVFCATLGCDKNLVDSEALLGRFARRGVRAVAEPEDADIWILNTCGFIDAARSDSAEALRELIDARTDQTLVVFGCWSQEHGDEIRRRFPEVDLVAGVGQFDHVVSACLGTPAPETVAPPTLSHDGGAFPLATTSGDVTVPSGPTLVGDPAQVAYRGLDDRPLLTPAHVAFVKIAEGCNCHCTFCRIPLIRGTQRSRPIADLVTEVTRLCDRGVAEIQLISQNTSDFGRDTGESLLDLVTALDRIDGLRRIRLLYLYAGLVSVDDLLRLLNLDTVVPYLDLPVQHASPRILRAMRRPGAEVAGAPFYRRLRRARPDLVLRSTALLGFPGEEDEDVAELADFLAEVEFDHLGTYRYSPEQGTAAADLPDRVPDEVILDREAIILDVQEEISAQRQESRLGRFHEVVVDEVYAGDDVASVQEVLASLAEGVWLDPRERSGLQRVLDQGSTVAVARSVHYGYDLDGVVLMPGEGLHPGQWCSAEFKGATAYDTWATGRSDR